MIVYRDTAVGLTPRQLHGFFVGWPSPPTPETHLRILHGSTASEVALDEVSEMVVGFVTAITDGVLCAYISLLEVLPEHQGQGIGKTLMSRMLARLGSYYTVDLLCDPNMQPFYGEGGMLPAVGMSARRYDRQSGIPLPDGTEEEVR